MPSVLKLCILCVKKTIYYSELLIKQSFYINTKETKEHRGHKENLNIILLIQAPARGV